MRKTLLSFVLFGAAWGHAQITLIPDSTFEGELVIQGIDSDGVVNGQVATVDVASLNSLDVQWLFISDLTGIEDFTALTVLNCSFNTLTSIDISQNTNLVEFRVAGNQLSSLDVSNNTSLEILDVVGNQLTNIDITQNVVLHTVWFLDNNFTDINLSGLPLLTTIGVWDNNLVQLNVANGNNINVVSFSATGNPNLECITVDDSVYSTANWPNIDIQSYFSNNCFASTVEDGSEPFSYFPNPVSDRLYFSNIPEGSELKIVGIDGRVYWQNYRITSSIMDIDVNDWSKGVYILQLTIGQNQISHKFVVH